MGNDEANGKNLKKVQVRLFGYELPTRTTLLGADSQSEIDIRHGELVFFKIGRVVSKRWHGDLPKGATFMDEEDVRRYLHNIGLGELSFEIWNNERQQRFGLHGRKLPDGPASVWPLGALVTAEETKSVQLSLKIDFGKESELVSVLSGVGNGADE